MNAQTPPPAPPAAAATPAAPSRRWLRRMVAGTGIGIALLGGAAWLLGREATLQQIFAQLARASGGQLVATHISGSLYGRMHIGRIVYRSADSVLTLDDIALNWSPLQYFSDGVAISELHAASAVMQATAPSKPPVMPASLAPPFRISIGDGRLERLSLIALDGARTEISAVRLSLHGDSQRWQLQSASAITPAGRIDATAQIGTSKPFKLTASATLRPLARPAPRSAAPADAPRLEATASGDLGELSVALAGSSPYATGSGTLLLAPFDRIALRSAALKAHNVDPSRFDPSLPQASLDLALQAAVAAGDKLSGTLAIANRGTAGPLDQHRLPIQAAAASLGGTLANATLDKILLDLGKAGQFTGSGSIQRAKADGAIDTAALRLHASRLNLQGLYGSAHATSIGGEVTLDSKAGQHTLHAALADKALHMEASARLHGQQLTLTQARIQAGQGSITLTGQASLQGDKAFKANASASKFDPSQLGAYPAADLNASLSASGKLAPAWSADAAWTLQPSRFAGQALSGSGKLQANAQHLGNVDAALAFGQNTATLRGSFGRAGEQLDWNVDAKQLAALDPRLQGALAASGAITGTYAAPRTSFSADLRNPGYAAAAPAAKGPAKATAIPAISATAGNARTASAATGALHAAGEAWLGADRALEIKANGSATALNPAAFGAPLQGSISASFDTTAHLAADWRATADIKLAPSTIGGNPLGGRATLAADSKRLRQIDIDLRLAANTLQAKGSFGAPQDRLDWKLDAPELSALGPQFAGTARGTGYASGALQQPLLAFSMDASKLRLPGRHELAALKASATIGAALGANDPLQADIDLAGYSGPATTLDRARLQATGTGGAHAVQASATSPDFDAALRLHGGYSKDVWSGSIDTLQNRGRFALTLQAPASLRLAAAQGDGPAGLAKPAQLSLSAAAIKMPEGLLRIEQLEKDGQRWRSKGTATGVNAAYLAQLSDTWRDNIASDLALGADWAIDLAAPQVKGGAPALDGSFHLFREKGDLTITGGARPIPLGLRTLDARLAVAGDALRLQADMDSQRGGTIKVSASARLQDGRIPGDSPLAVNASADIPSIVWLSPLAGVQGLELDGAVKATASGSGTVAAPQLNGEVSGDKLVINWAEQGIRLRNGQLQAKVTGDQLLLQRLRFDGVEGSAQAEGWMRLAGGEATMDLKLAADKLEVLARPDRTLVVSGRSTLVRDAKHFQLEGKFRADRASIELPSLDTPTISDDVVILGRDKPGAKAAAAQSQPLNVDLEADLGDDFYLKGKGLDAQLAGAARIRITDRRAPRVTGSVRVASGTYAAYGQKLAIERGVLNFTGAYDNPGLNIRAVRKRPEGEELSETNVEAGVEVRGTALAPSAKLVSTPSVPDSEKLAWLVLGHGTADVAGKEMALLGTAASALLGGNGPSLANRVGLDELGVAQAKGLESTVVTVGKKLSSRAYLSFEQGAGSATSLVKLRYKLNPRITLQVQTGTNNALDVLYTWAFD